MNNIGLMYERMGQMEKAFWYFKKGLDIKVATKANEKAIIISQKNVAHSLASLGRYDEALQEMDKAFKMLEKFPGLYHEVRAIIYDAKSRIYMKSGDYHRAIKMLQDAIQLRANLSPENINTIENMHLLAKANLRLAKFKESRDILDKIFRMRENIIKVNPRDFHIVQCVYLAFELESLGTNIGSLETLYKIGKEDLGRLYTEFDARGITERCQYVEQEKSKLDREHGTYKSMVQRNIDSSLTDVWIRTVNLHVCYTF